VALVVFASGVIDERPRPAGRRPQYGRPGSVVNRSGVEPGWWPVGGWVLAHCWALRNQARTGLVVRCLLSLVVRVACGWGLVGGVFEKWIVDASI
jgi:hypothetical protein